jgi:hypothetical protein
LDAAKEFELIAGYHDESLAGPAIHWCCAHEFFSRSNAPLSVIRPYSTAVPNQVTGSEKE